MVCRGELAGPRTLAGNAGQPGPRPGRHRLHGDGRHCGRERRVVRLFVRPEFRGVPAEVPAGRVPGCHSTVRAVRFGLVRVAAPPLLHRGGRVKRRRCSSASWPCACRRAGNGGCGKLCAPRHSGCASYGFCWRCWEAACGRKRSWCKYQWPCAVDGLRKVSHCSTRPPAWATWTRRCRPRWECRLDVPVGRIRACR